MSWNDRMADLEGPANEVAIKAEAILPCDLHPDILRDMGDPVAEERAFSIGTIRWKQGDLGCDREHFLEAIQKAIESSSDGCPFCRKIARKD